MSGYADLVVNSVEINKNPAHFADKDAVHKQYVDGKVAELVDTAPELFNTLNELSAVIGENADFVTTIQGQVAAALGELEGRITDQNAIETQARIDGDAALTDSIGVETAARRLADTEEATARANDVAAINANLAEKDVALNDLTTDVAAVQSQTAALSTNKLDSSSKYLKEAEGNFKVSEDAYLYIGNMWRIAANNVAGSTKRLEFQYLEGVDEAGIPTWSVGVPFIRSAPASD